MTDQAPPAEVPAKVECPAVKDTAVRLFIGAAMLIGFGSWCFVDGYIRNTVKKEDIDGINKAATYYLNNVGGIVFPLAGLIPLAFGIRSMRRRLVADDDGIGYVGKAKIPWSTVKSLDASKLAEKGVLILNWDDDGAQTKLALCSWKLEKFRELVALVESKVSPPQPGE